MQRTVVKATLTWRRNFAVGNSRYWANQRETTYSDEHVDQWKASYPKLKSYSSEALQKWRNAFDLFDRDNDGSISQADLQKNPNLSLQKWRLLQEHDKDQNHLIDFGEFVDAISSLDILDLITHFDGFDEVDVHMEFSKFAILGADHSEPVIRIEEMKRLMTYCDCTCVTDFDAKRLLDKVDVDKDGAVSFQDFKTWLNAHRRNKRENASVG